MGADAPIPPERQLRAAMSAPTGPAEADAPHRSGTGLTAQPLAVPRTRGWVVDAMSEDQ